MLPVEYLRLKTEEREKEEEQRIEELDAQDA